MIDCPSGKDPSWTVLAGDYSPDWDTAGSSILYADGHVKVKTKD